MSLFRRQRKHEAARAADSGLPGRLPWEPRSDDLGLQIVDAIGHSLSLDEEWSVRDARGFTWWGKDLAQRVWAEPAFDDDGFEIFRLHARTDLLRDFNATTENLAKVNAFAALATTSGYLVDGEAGTVQYAASMYAHAETRDWVGKTFQLIVAMQAADAQIKASVLAELTGSSVAATPHPASGPRPDYDDMLNVLEAVVAPLGQLASAWYGEEMEWITSVVQSGRYTVLATGDESGLSAEFPFQSRTSLVTVTTEAGNLQVGNGVLMILHLPMNIEETDGVRFAAKLTRRELSSVTRTHYLGCWCWREDGLHFVTFLPNAIRTGRGDLLNIVMATTGRAKWAAETFYGDDWLANLDEQGQPLARPAIEDFLADAGDRDGA